MRSLEINNTIRIKAIIDEKIDATSPIVESQLHRRFYPEQKTVKFNWPNYSYTPSWQLDLGDNELISVSQLVAGGVALTGDGHASSSQFFLRRWDDKDEPPYSYIEINLATSAAFSSGTTFQRAIEITGLFSGDKDTSTALTHGLLGGNITNVATSLVINPSAGIYPVGVGSLILIGTERLIIVERQMSAVAGQTLVSTMDASQADKIVDVASGALFASDEIILLGAERMRIEDIAGNNLIVERAFDGTALTTHGIGEQVYALRTFTAKRGQLGSTAAAHNLNDPIYVHQYPGPVAELTKAETLVLIEQDSAAYARVIGSGGNAIESGGKGLEDVRKRAFAACGRAQLRHAAI